MIGVTNFRKGLIVARTILALLGLILLPGGVAPAGAGGHASMLAGYGEIRAAIDGRPTKSTLEEGDDQGSFEEVLAASCGAGNGFECGLLSLWRAVATVLNFFERLATLGMIAFLFPWLIWSRWRDGVEGWRRRAKKNARDAAIESRPPKLSPF